MCVNMCVYLVFLFHKSLILEMQVLVAHLRLYVFAHKIHIHIVSECAFMFTRRSLALERSRQILPLKDGAYRG